MQRQQQQPHSDPHRVPGEQARVCSNGLMLFTLNTHKDMGPVPTSTQWVLTLTMAERKEKPRRMPSVRCPRAGGVKPDSSLSQEPQHAFTERRRTSSRSSQRVA
ncbi:unnamed protein product [Boreogadus saida]